MISPPGLCDKGAAKLVATFPGPAISPDTSPILRVAGVSKTYAETVAVKPLSFALPAGSVTGLLGGNGAGRTRSDAGMPRPCFARDPERALDVFLSRLPEVTGKTDDCDAGSRGRCAVVRERA
ncbi:hypothetical protein [Methylosinus sp. KRF6]|uniref:hypothetical protein n=1 Tax=Methylosinus sporium TaxID=428 RepID=UPI00209A9C0A|nr:hypothetical protein [Methylosinus sp. KRF6]